MEFGVPDSCSLAESLSEGTSIYLNTACMGGGGSPDSRATGCFDEEVRGFFIYTSPDQDPAYDTTEFEISASHDLPGVGSLHANQLDALQWKAVCTGAWVTSFNFDTSRAMFGPMQHRPINRSVTGMPSERDTLFIMDPSAMDWKWPSIFILVPVLNSLGIIAYIVLGNMHLPKHARWSLIGTSIIALGLEIAILSVEEDMGHFLIHMSIPITVFDCIMFLATIFEK